MDLKTSDAFFSGSGHDFFIGFGNKLNALPEFGYTRKALVRPLWIHQLEKASCLLDIKCTGHADGNETVVVVLLATYDFIASCHALPKNSLHSPGNVLPELQQAEQEKACQCERTSSRQEAKIEHARKTPLFKMQLTHQGWKHQSKEKLQKLQQGVQNTMTYEVASVKTKEGCQNTLA